MNIEQHQVEILRNKRIWESKPLLRKVYSSFYNRISALIEPSIKGKIVELGSGAGNLKSVISDAVCTDIFPNPWLDIVCSAYAIPFENGSVSHLVLFDVFHHLQRPKAFFQEARRVLAGNGRIIIFEPYISVASRIIYGLFHHEPLAWKQPIENSEQPPSDDQYYAAQGNATRFFFHDQFAQWLEGWKIFHKQTVVSFSYLLSGGYSKPAMYPEKGLKLLQRFDDMLSRYPSLFAARCLIGLTPDEAKDNNI
jgi:SAM-dependent methyltransferase